MGKWQISSCIKNCGKHATQFINNFCRRGYSEAKLKAICEILQKMSKEQLLIYRKKDKSDRVTLVLPLHHKSRGIQQVLQKSYKLITCNPDLKQIFPNPPMISFRRVPNIPENQCKQFIQGTRATCPHYLQKENLILLTSLTTPRQLLTPSVTKHVIQKEAIPIPLKQCTLLYVQNIRN